MDSHQVRNVLQQLRNRAGSANRLAVMLGIESKTLKSWLTGEVRLQNLSIDKILALAREYGIALEKPVRPLWNAQLSFSANIANHVPEPPELDQPLKVHGVQLFGKAVCCPFGASASVVTSNASFVKYHARTGSGVITYKTVRNHHYDAHAWPNLFFCRRPAPESPDFECQVVVGSGEDPECRPDHGALNWYGMPSPTPHSWASDFRTALSHIHGDQLLILSVVGSVEKHPVTADLLDQAFLDVVDQGVDCGAEFVELNLSCPNAKEGALYKDAQAVARICREIRRRHRSLKLLLKIGYLPPNDLHTFVLQTAEYVNGYSAINTLPVRGVRKDQDRLVPAFADHLAGLSGSPIKQLALRTIKGLRDLRADLKLGQQIVLIATGGVSSGEDAMEFYRAGADIVQASTAFLSNPLFGLEVRRYLDNHLPPYRDQSVVALTQAYAEALRRHLDCAPEDAITRVVEVSSAVFAERFARHSKTVQSGPRKSSNPPSADEIFGQIQRKLDGRTK